MSATKPPVPPGSTSIAGNTGTTGSPRTSAAPAGIEALADSLSACADALHDRTMRAIRQRQPGAAADSVAQDRAHGITQEAAQALFDQEVMLRQCANSLYVQAAALTAAGFDQVRQDLMDVTAVARDRLRHVVKVQALASLAAGLVALAQAIVAGKPEQWPGAIRDVRGRLASLHDSGKA